MLARDCLFFPPHSVCCVYAPVFTCVCFSVDLLTGDHLGHVVILSYGTTLNLFITIWDRLK